MARLEVPTSQYLTWSREALLSKASSELPAKTVIRSRGEPEDFHTTMPCLLPDENLFGLKVVSRRRGRQPLLRSQIFLFDAGSGECIAMVEADAITRARTAATATLAVEALASTDIPQRLGVMGLGAIGKAFLDTCLQSCGEYVSEVLLLRHRGQAEDVRSHLERALRGTEPVTVTIVDSVAELVSGSSVVVSAVSFADKELAPAEWFKSGSVLVPLHTRGFQSCDAQFDRVVGDDWSHIAHFDQAPRFREFVELGAVLAGKSLGRKTAEERIIVYTVGIGLTDVYIAKRLLERIPPEWDQPMPTSWRREV